MGKEEEEEKGGAQVQDNPGKLERREEVKRVVRGDGWGPSKCLFEVAALLANVEGELSRVAGSASGVNGQNNSDADHDVDHDADAGLAIPSLPGGPCRGVLPAATLADLLEGFVISLEEGEPVVEAPRRTQPMRRRKRKRMSTRNEGAGKEYGREPRCTALSLQAVHYTLKLLLQSSRSVKGQGSEGKGKDVWADGTDGGLERYLEDELAHRGRHAAGAEASSSSSVATSKYEAEPLALRILRATIGLLDLTAPAVALSEKKAESEEGSQGGESEGEEKADHKSDPINGRSGEEREVDGDDDDENEVEDQQRGTSSDESPAQAKMDVVQRLHRRGLRLAFENHEFVSALARGLRLGVRAKVPCASSAMGTVASEYTSSSQYLPLIHVVRASAFELLASVLEESLDSERALGCIIEALPGNSESCNGPDTPPGLGEVAGEFALFVVGQIKREMVEGTTLPILKAALRVLERLTDAVTSAGGVVSGAWRDRPPAATCIPGSSGGFQAKYCAVVCESLKWILKEFKINHLQIVGKFLELCFRLPSLEDKLHLIKSTFEQCLPSTNSSKLGDKQPRLRWLEPRCFLTAMISALTEVKRILDRTSKDCQHKINELRPLEGLEAMRSIWKIEGAPQDGFAIVALEELPPPRMETKEMEEREVKTPDESHIEEHRPVSPANSTSLEASFQMELEKLGNAGKKQKFLTHTCNEDETPRGLAKLYGCNVKAFIEANTPKWGKMYQTSKFKRKTVVLIPVVAAFEDGPNQLSGKRGLPRYTLPDRKPAAVKLPQKPAARSRSAKRQKKSLQPIVCPACSQENLSMVCANCGCNFLKLNKVGEWNRIADKLVPEEDQSAKAHQKRNIKGQTAMSKKSDAKDKVEFEDLSLLRASQGAPDSVLSFHSIIHAHAFTLGRIIRQLRVVLDKDPLGGAENSSGDSRLAAGLLRTLTALYWSACIFMKLLHRMVKICPWLSSKQPRSGCIGRTRSFIESELGSGLLSCFGVLMLSERVAKLGKLPVVSGHPQWTRLRYNVAKFEADWSRLYGLLQSSHHKTTNKTRSKRNNKEPSKLAFKAKDYSGTKFDYKNKDVSIQECTNLETVFQKMTEVIKENSTQGFMSFASYIDQGQQPAAIKSLFPRKRGKRGRLRSRNKFIDQELIHERGHDSYAELEDFIVYDEM